MTPDKKNDKTFSNTEVGVLVESLRSDFRAVAEGQTALRGDMDDVKERLSGVERRLIFVEDAVRVAIPSINSRLAKAGI